MVRPLPDFSIIIPVRNEAPTVARAIDSALAQSHPARDIIVVDDGSTDGTVEIVSRYGDKVIFIRQQASGVAAARNRGAEVAQGEWLAFLDADDWYYPNRLSRYAEWLARDPDLDFITSAYHLYHSGECFFEAPMESIPFGRALLGRANERDEVVVTADEFDRLLTGHVGNTLTVSMPRETYRRIGGYPAGFEMGEDLYLFARLCAASRRVGVLCRPTAVYFIRSDSTTRRDRVAARGKLVEAMRALKAEARGFPEPVRRGVDAYLRGSRRSFAYALVRCRRRARAISAVLPSLWEYPGYASLRDVLTVIRG